MPRLVESPAPHRAAPDRRSPAYARWVQGALNRLDGAGLAVDGSIGPRTRAVLRRFQAAHGLVADGVVGPRTEAALRAAGAGDPPGGTDPRPPARPPAPQAVCGPPPEFATPARTALALTTRFEVGVPFGCVASATDGISLGMLQWNLRAGTLQGLLGAFEAGGGDLATLFGPDAARLRAWVAARTSREGRERAVSEATTERLAARWREPLLRLCADPAFCGLIQRDIRGRMTRAQAVAADLSLGTIRGLCMIFDIEVGDGLGRTKAATFAARQRAREAEAGRPPTEREKVGLLAEVAAELAGRWRDERLARRRLIAEGHGRYRGGEWNLDAIFPNLDEPLR